MFSAKSFIVSGLTFRSLIHFEFIFVCGVGAFSFHSLTRSCPVSRHQLTEEAIPPLSLLGSFVKDKVPAGVWAYLWAFYLVCISGFVPVPYCLDSNGYSVASSLGVEKPVSPPAPNPTHCSLLSQDLVRVSRFFLISLFCSMVKLSLHTALSYWSPLGTFAVWLPDYPWLGVWSGLLSAHL